ncbi:DUF5987 family protein [Catellatospora aurea]|uniref:DUF5987 family protein n=1 Tax=Catellatospora aurea TaxID=1337874 RepID=A0ABW2H5J5_9ACTN
MAALLAAVASPAGIPASPAHATWSSTIDTLTAFTDTLIPGAKRFPGDTAVAGEAPGPGGADSGFIALLTDQRTGTGPFLDAIATTLNTRALGYAISHGIWIPPFVPPFVALAFRHRSAVVAGLFEPDQPDRDLWSVMVLLSGIAFDAAAHLPTAAAVISGHPGLTYLRFPEPDPDGLWRHPTYSYRRSLATAHPQTTAEGNPS